MKVKVLVASGEGWLTKWDTMFGKLEISHLRSPLFFHPSPADNDALVAFAQREGRENELEPIHGVVGRERSKHMRKKGTKWTGRTAWINEREREDYHRPSTSLSSSFCSKEISCRYDLKPLVEHASVLSVSYGALHLEGQEKCQGFTIHSTRPDGTIQT